MIFAIMLVDKKQCNKKDLLKILFVRSFICYEHKLNCCRNILTIVSELKPWVVKLKLLVECHRNLLILDQIIPSFRLWVNRDAMQWWPAPCPGLPTLLLANNCLHHQHSPRTLVCQHQHPHDAPRLPA